MPMDGGRFIQIVRNLNGYIFSFFKSENWPWCLPIVSNARAGKITSIDLNRIDGESIFTCTNRRSIRSG